VETRSLSHRYPAEIIAQCMRLYYRFPLSHRGIEALLYERGIIVSYESIRRRRHTFGPTIAAELRSRRPQPKGTGHLDKMYIKMNGKTYYLRRAVDAEGTVLAIAVQERRTERRPSTPASPGGPVLAAADQSDRHVSELRTSPPAPAPRDRASQA
jgi:transposase-like protein